MHETAKKIILKKATTRELLQLRELANRASGWANVGGITISIEELKEELAKRPHVPNKAESRAARRAAAANARKSKERRRR